MAVFYIFPGNCDFISSCECDVRMRWSRSCSVEGFRKARMRNEAALAGAASSIKGLRRMMR